MHRAVLILSISLCATCGAPARTAPQVAPPAITSSCDEPPGVSAARPTRHDVTGRVLDTAGRPVAGARVGAAPDFTPAAPSPPVITDANGAFQWTTWVVDSPIGEVRRIALAALAPNGDEARLAKLNTDPEPVTVVVHGTRELAGRITAAGAPLAGAQVWISCDRVIAAAGFECADAIAVRTDATGAFRARVAAPATHFIDVRADLARWRSPLVQVLDRDRTNLALDLPAIAPVALRVVDSADRPLAGVAVTPDCADEAAGLATDAAGQVALRARVDNLVPNAIFDVCVAKPGYVAQEIIRRPDDATIILARAATLCGRVRAPVPGAGAMTVVATTSPDGKQIVTLCRGCETNAVRRELPAAGAFRLDVPAGTYRLWADVAGVGGTRSRRVDARPGATIDIGTLDLASPTASLSGVVRDLTGKPAALPEIFLQRLVTGMDGEINEAARTLTVGADGRFSATGLPQGTYRLQFGNQSENLAIRGAGATLELRFDPDMPRGCPDCDPEPFDAATYGGPWIPAFDRLDDVISGPKAGIALAPGVVPGDVIELSDGRSGTDGLEGKRDTPVHLQIFRAGTDQHLDVTVKRTLPAND